MVCVKSTRALDYASESRTARNRPVFRLQMQLRSCNTAQERYNPSESDPKRRFRMKRILLAICYLTLCCLPALAQKEHAAKGAAMTAQDFINMAAQTDMMEAHLGQMAAEQASSQDVKTYAQMLVTDHTADYQQLGTLA